MFDYRLHLHNPSKVENMEKTSSIHSKEGAHQSTDDNPIEVPVTKFGFHTAHYYGPVFSVPPDIWEDTWVVRN